MLRFRPLFLFDPSIVYNALAFSLRSVLCLKGIVQAKLPLQSLDRHNDFASLRFDFPDHLRRACSLVLRLQINGTCLTVRSIEGKRVSFDAIAQTL